MINQETRPTGITRKSRAEEVREDALAALRQATTAIEAETAALKELEEAHLSAENAIAEAKNATEAENAARLEMRQAQSRAKQAFVEAEKATRLEEKANKARERKDDKLRTEEAKVSEAQMSGKEPNLAARDEAMQGADEAGLTAIAALREAEKARETAAVANKDVNEAQGKAVEASTRTFTAKEAEAAAKKRVTEAEHNARKAVAEAQTALQLETDAKKTLDWAINKLKALNLHHANASVETVAEYTEENSQRLGEPTQATSSDGAGTGEEQAVEKPNAEICSGLVRLLIASPVDHISVRRLQERLEEVEGFRVSSVSGSSATGASITITTDRPFPLLPWLSANELVDRVSMNGRHIEVTLRPSQQEIAMKTDVPDSLSVRPDPLIADNERTAQQGTVVNEELEKVLGSFSEAVVASDEREQPTQQEAAMDAGLDDHLGPSSDASIVNGPEPSTQQEITAKTDLEDALLEFSNASIVSNSGGPGRKKRKH